jgi:YbbR domain-containing protein
MEQWIRNHTVLKVIALLIGIMLWMVVNYNDAPGSPNVTPDSTMTIRDVEVIPYVDANRFASVRIEPRFVTVVLTGKVSALNKINTGDFETYVDLSKLGSGDHQYIPVGIKGLPVNVSVQVVPSLINVSLEEKIHKEMNISLDVIGSPAAGFKAGAPVIAPSKVKLTGSESLLESVAKVEGKVDISGAEGEVDQKTKLIAYDAAGNELEVTIEPQVIGVKIPITTPFKKLPLILDVRGEVASGYAIASIEKNVDNVTVSAMQEVLDALDFYMGPIFNVSNMKNSDEYILSIPVHGGVLKADPTELTVQIEIVPLDTKVFEQVPIEINGGADGSEVSWIGPENGRINIEIAGAPALLEGTTLDDIQGFVDISQLPSGSHRVLVQWNLPLYLKSVGEPIYVTLEIKQP